MSAPTAPVTELRGLALLDAAIAQIEKHPETWQQGDWRCKSGMCIAGWAAQIAGGRWINPADDAASDRLEAEPDDEPGDVYRPGGAAPFIYAADRAHRLLDLTWDERDDLFAALSSLDRIREVRDDIACARGQS